MYTNKNKAFSLIEIIISTCIILIISSILATLIYSFNRSYILIYKNYKREKEIENFIDLIKYHTFYNEKKEVKICEFKDIKSYSSNSILITLPFSKNFKNEKIEGNSLILKLFLKEDNNINVVYRAFILKDKEAFISYTDDEIFFSEKANLEKMLSNCDGKFIKEGNNIKIIIEDKTNEKKYQFYF